MSGNRKRDTNETSDFGLQQRNAMKDLESRLFSCRLRAVLLALFSLALAGQTVAAQQRPDLVVAIPTDGISLDPHKSSTAADYPILNNIFEGLYGHDENGNLMPFLAVSVNTSPDALTYEFSLRKNAKFHNGDPVTAADVRFSWKRAIDPALRNPRASSLVANIADVEVIDDHTVKLTLKQRDPALLDNMNFLWAIVPKNYIESVGNEEFGKRPIGTGPFAFVEKRQNEYSRIKGFEQHWGRIPKINVVTYKIVPDDQARLAQVQTGEADLITNIPPPLAARAEKIQGVHVIARPAMSHESVQFNALNGSRLSDRNVRIALNMLVDRKGMAKTVMSGYAAPEILFCAKGTTGCDIKIDLHEYDPKTGREMLVKAGFDFSKPLKFVGPLGARMPQGKEVMEVISYFFKQAGVKVDLVTMDFGAWLAVASGKVKDPTIDMCMAIFPDYSKDNIVRLRRQMLGTELWSWVSDKDLDAMLDQAINIADPKEREVATGAILKKIHDDAFNMPLWTVSNIYLARNGIAWSPALNATWPVLWNIEKKS
jgi:peptide/nickel transport system substrate-binding protein